MYGFLSNERESNVSEMQMRNELKERNQTMKTGIVCAVLKGGAKPVKVADYVRRMAAGFPEECWNQPLAFYPLPRDPRNEGAVYFGSFLTAQFMMMGIKMDLNSLKFAFRDDSEGEGVLVWVKSEYPESLDSSAPKVPAH